MNAAPSPGYRSSLPPQQPQTQPRERSTAPLRPMLHLLDIVEQADNVVNPLLPIPRLLEHARSSLATASSYVDFYQRPDLALLEFFVAGNIISKIIPSHKDAGVVRTGDHPRLQALYGECIQSFRAKEPYFESIKEQVKADNRASGVYPLSSRPSSSSGLSRQSAASSTPPPTPPPHGSRPSSSYNSSSPNGVRSQSPYRNSLPSYSSTPKQKPAVQPKPQNLHGHAITANGQQPPPRPTGIVSSDDLSERFSRLRANKPATSSNGQPPPNGTASARPQPTIRTPSSLSKQLPRIPSPTYSPARSTPPPTSVTAAPSPRSSVLTPSDSPPSLSSNASLHYQSSQSSYSSSNHAPQPNGVIPPSQDGQQVQRRRRPSDHQSVDETQVSAKHLFDYLRTFNVLLVDVRPREEYDNGHIFSRSVICVEPVALRPNMSAEELVDSLCISPDYEPELFEQRDKFNLVVYYDQSTTNTDFLREKPGSNMSLKYLFDALYDFNQEKPLSRRPLLLAGGMDAWVDLLGSNALATSNTAAARNKAAKASRPLARRPATKESARLALQKRRHREYNPLAPEEEQKWREQVRSESVALQSPLSPPEEDQYQRQQELPTEGIGNSTDFQVRYPDVDAIERQAQQWRPPPRAPPQVPSIPSYPETPVPTVPSRPPPAVPRPSYSGVSERLATQSSGVSKSSQLAPYIPPYLQRLPKTGLHNFGVTCYMNATIQCLSATTQLTQFFFDQRFLRFIQQDNWKGSKGLMPELYNTLLHNLWRCNDNETIRPINFRKFCARLNREWGIDRQQDAKEFLDFLIDTLHEDFNSSWAKTPLRALTAEQEAHRERMPPFLVSNTEWQRYIHRDSSLLTELFGGQHLSRLQCTTCKRSSTTYETFYSVSVEIPTPGSKKKPVTLDDCLRSYCSAEMLSEDDYWRCPNCKAPRQASKRITITRAPQYLVIHLKRFSASHSERAKKVHTPVDFPLRGLDLGPYMLPQPDEQSLAQWRKTYSSENSETPTSMTPPYKYDAYAVMRHIGGTMTSGHYISLVEDKARGCWREFNDSVVSDFQPEQLDRSRSLQNEQAYIVFYKRVE